jgi:steroid delta-isomerase-like uncharacterized protein
MLGKHWADLQARRAWGYLMVSAETQTTQERVLEDWARYWSSHDWDHLLPLFTDDVVYEDVTLAAVNHGKQQLRAFGEAFFSSFPDVTFELTSRFASGSQGGVEWVMRGTHGGDMGGISATGKHVEVRGASVMEFANGKIRRNSDYWDMATLLNQLGQTAAG